MKPHEILSSHLKEKRAALRSLQKDRQIRIERLCKELTSIDRESARISDEIDEIKDALEKIGAPVPDAAAQLKQWEAENDAKTDGNFLPDMQRIWAQVMNNHPKQQVPLSEAAPGQAFGPGLGWTSAYDKLEFK